jgi:flagellar biosynthesis/type III secretory pathway M-ring protein FliF/YscJ
MNFGPDRARVKINSEWDFDHSVTRSETHPSSKSILAESKRTTKTPAGEATLGGPAGTASNLSDPVLATGTNGTGLAGSQGIVIPPPMAETEDNRKTYADATVLTETVRTVPVLKHLSISLIFDDALVERQAELEQAVQAAAGYRSERGDVFSSMPTQFYKPEVVAEDAVGSEDVVETAPSEPSPLLQTLLERGVEIVSALAFVFLLLKSLKGKREKVQDLVPVATEDSDPKIDPEALARAQLDELLTSDPDRIGQILSDWVREESEALARSA